MSQDRQRLVRIATVLLFVVAGMFTTAEAKKTPIPMRSGEVVEQTVLELDSKGIIVATEHGSMRIPWSQVDPSYPKHPEHQETRASDESAGEPGVSTAPDGAETSSRRRRPSVTPPSEPGVSTTHDGAKASSRQGQASRTKKASPPATVGALARDGFTYLLFFGYVLFWLNIYAVSRIRREDILSGIEYQTWNFLALVVGPIALPIYTRWYKGGRGNRGGAQLPGCCLYTWDNQPVKTGANRNILTGLTMAEAILGRAVRMDASDIHFNATGDGVSMGFRVDGVLREPEVISGTDGKKIVTAIKTAAGMDVARIHEAQDGACHMVCDEQWYDLRIARAWAVTGETVVVRLLKAGGVGSELAGLGMFPPMVEAVKKLTKDTAGIIVLAGPTGSGKTSTIYALLRQIVGTGRNIVTIEDPVEYLLDGATQISINAKAGATFASTLKASMRQDPDVILVGEIRDSEAMHVAFQASLTGHLVFTTIHASSVLATYGRMHELGLSAYLINTGLKAIVCQRLVRKLCPTCREAYAPDLPELQMWGFKPEEGVAHLFYKPVGCGLCEGSGYHGRTAIYRALVMNNAIRSRVRTDVPVGELQAVVEQFALGHVQEYAREWLCSGLTSPEEMEKHLEMFDYGKQLWHTDGPAAPTAELPAAGMADPKPQPAELAPHANTPEPASQPLPQTAAASAAAAPAAVPPEQQGSQSVPSVPDKPAAPSSPTPSTRIRVLRRGRKN